MHTSEEQIYTAITIAAVFLGVLIIVFITTMIRHQRRNVELHKEKIKAEINTLEKERKRIATDLHDELGPVLSTVRIQINHLNDLNKDNPEENEIITSATKHIDDIIAKTREISYNLLPNTLVRKGLIKAVQEFVNKFSDTKELSISFHPNVTITIPDDMAINIYRIVQEIVHNTLKHSEASQLMLRMYIKNDKLVLISADDGLGFHFEKKINEGKGLGLLSLQSRIEILNAKFDYQSEPGHGTQYVFEIPLKMNS